MKISKGYQAFTPGNEIRSYIYQQAQDLQHYVDGLGAVAVAIEKKSEAETANSEDKIFGVKFLASFDEEQGELLAEGYSRTLIEACRNAKSELIQKIRLFTTPWAQPRESTESLASGSHPRILH